MYCPRYDRMVPRVADVTPATRIRDAALESFARVGTARTTIRSIAADVGVSPGLVQHHFATKEALRAAVDRHVVELAAEAFADPPPEGPASDVQRAQGDRVTAFVRDHPSALLYVARGAADGEPGALAIFDAFVTVARTQWEALAGAGHLRPDADLLWAALHVVVLNLGTVLLADAIERHLAAPFLEPGELDRWNAASTRLFETGLYRP